ncbi:MAG: CotH protein [Planctomycetes bacterium ADurb.Bin412]|nr:MAG: CotH protein [Planctomycetes bacterium ADurb.Bin412]
MEKIKRDKNRVNIQKLEPTDNTEPEISGGYIIKRDWEGANFYTSLGVPLLYNDPEAADLTAQQKIWIQNYYNAFETALYSSNFADPVNGYAKYIDVDRFIDSYWLVELTRNLDGFRASFYMHKDRGGKLKTGPTWDFDVALGNAYWESRPDYLPEGWRVLYGDPYNEQQWYPRLFADPEFEIKWQDRWVELRKNLWSTDVLMTDIDAAAYLLDEAQVRQFQRWPILGTYVNFNPPGWTERDTYQKEVDWLKDWLQTRVNWIDSQIIHPLFNKEGGRVYSGFLLTMSLPAGASGQIYYTLDGNDPRLPGGAIRPGAANYASSGPLTLTAGTHIKARIQAGTEWSALNEAQFSIGPMVLINEFMAGNSSTIEDPDEPNEFPDWVELYNPSPFTVDLSGMYLTDNLADPAKWRIPAGLSIDSGGRLVFWIDDDGTQGPNHTSFKLGIEGEQIGLYDTDGITVIDSKIFGLQTMDISYGRTFDGGPDWQFLTCPTPGRSNFIPDELDLNGDCAVNLEDFTNFSSHWLEENIPTEPVVWDYAAEFSVYQGNPNGVWTYGLYDGSDFSSASFILYNSTVPISTLDPWALNGDRDTYGSCQKNIDESNPLSQPTWPNGMYWEPGQTSLMVPASELYGTWRPTARFTAPAASEYQVDARFWSGTVNGNPTHVYVLVNRALVHSDQIIGYYSEPDSSSLFSDLLVLDAGDTVDFCVGTVIVPGQSYEGYHLVQFDAVISTTAFCGGPGFEYLPGDINTDCVVDLDDFVLFATQWLGSY